MKRHLVLALVVLAALGVANVPVARAESQVAVFTIAGLVYEDQNADGVYGLGKSGIEPGIANVTVSLYRDNAPLNILGPEDELLESQVTNAEGYIVLRDIPQGAYFLRSAIATNLIATTPSVQALTLAGDVRGAALEWMFGLTQRTQMPVRAFMPVISR